MTLEKEVRRLGRAVNQFRAALAVAIAPQLEPLLGIGRRIAAQDNRATDQPMFVVFQKREIVVDGDYDHDRIAWIGEEGREPDEETAAKLDAMRNDIESDHFMAGEIEIDDEDEGREEWRYLALKEVDEFVTACFTEQGCKEFLAIHGHNLRQPFIYAAGSFRNREYQQLRTLMLNLVNEGEQS